MLILCKKREASKRGSSGKTNYLIAVNSQESWLGNYMSKAIIE